MIKRLKQKFVTITMALVTVMLCVILGLVLLFADASLERESIQQLQNAGSMDFRPGRPGKGSGAAVFTMVITSRGDLMVTGSSYFDLTDEAYLLEIAEKALSASEATGKLREYNLRYYREESLGGVRLSFSDISREKQIMRSMTLVGAAIGLASLLAFFGISLLLARWAVQPVEKTWEQQKQFVADASHELKTPLTVITTNAELLLQPGQEEGEKLRFSGNILTMAQQMRQLVEGMLELARGDNESLKMQLSPVDVSALAGECCLLFEPVAYEYGLALETAIAQGVAVQGSESHLRQVLEILLDNGVKYSAKPGGICVSLWEESRECVLTVENTGPEIPKEELEKIFCRFYRMDRARTGGSFGLGLSIAQSIVTAHGGRIWAESGSGVNRFLVRLPKTKTAL